MVHYFLRISSLSPSPMVSGRSGSSRHEGLRKPMSALKNPITSETADVPPFFLVQINFFLVSGRGVPAPLAPPPPPPPPSPLSSAKEMGGNAVKSR